MNGFALPAHEAGRYGEIKERITSNMATTFVTAGTELKPPAVIKGVPADATILQKKVLTTEAKILGALDHPQIPDLIEDHTGEEDPYFIMTREDGMPSMNVALTTKGSEAAAKIISSVADPLGYVHGEGFVHGDIKPDNIIAQRTGRSALIDFGAAMPRPYGHLLDSGQMEGGSPEHVKAREHMLKFGRPLTSGRVVCSAEYMSPEQANNQRVDITSDFYNLGITAYELFYGRVPFQVETPRNAKPRSLESSAYDAVISPKEQRARRLAQLHKEAEIDFTVPDGKDIPPAVISMIERATQKDPADRYQSADELLEDVEVVLHAVA